MLVELPDDDVEALRRILAAIDAARVAPAEKESGGSPVELNETMMAARLGIRPEALQKRRERGACEGLYRRSGRSIIYSVPLTEAAWRNRPDIPPDSSI